MNILDTEKLWLPQTDERSCGLVALRMALRFFGVETTNAELQRELISLGLRVIATGVFAPYLGILAQRREFKTIVRYPIALLDEIRNPKQPSSFALEPSHTAVKCSKTRSYLYRSLRQYLMSGGKVIVYSYDAPNITHITNAMRKRAPVLVGVSCRNYYGILNEDWDHVLTLIPRSGRFVVLDSFKERGRNYYGKKKWARCLRLAQRFCWDEWFGDMVEIHPK